ncbi:MAG: hypothetical protein Q8P29_03740 [Candidatus Levybacteria bacterium]|nr:hypothetical protein [Candidatus Levybacteria bacterium]
MENQLENPDFSKRTPERQFTWTREQSSPEVNRLFERYAEGDPNVELVFMNDGKSIQVGPDGEEKTIITIGLGGCYGTLVFTEHEDGRRNGVLTHYDPTQISVNMSRLRELLGQDVVMKEAKTKQTVIVMGTGEWVQDPETKKWKLEPSPESKKQVDGIILAIQAELGKDVEVKFEPYSRLQKIAQKDQGTMVVTIPPKGKGDARFKTWFSAGKLGSEEK